MFKFLALVKDYLCQQDAYYANTSERSIAWLLEGRIMLNARYAPFLAEINRNDELKSFLTSRTYNTFSVETAEDSSGFLLWQVTALWQQKIRKALEQYDLTHTQFVLLTSLHWLLIHNQEVTQIVLSQHSKIDPMTTSSVLRMLQKKGLIRRQEHSTDTRAKTLNITTKGKELIKKAVVTVERIDRDFFAILGENVPTLNKFLNELKNQ